MADVTLVSQPEAALVAITDEAQRALGSAGEVRIAQGSLSVGRDRRSPLDDAGLPAKVREQRLGEAPQLNDVYLLEDPSRTLHVSGVHFMIECIDGLFFLTDRRSACGTIVAGRRIGGRRKGGRTELRDGDEVIVGTSKSPYVFRFRVAPAGP